MKAVIKLLAISSVAMFAVACAGGEDGKKADEALRVAHEAKAQSIATQEALDRMFVRTKNK
ncbi:hypothetical protein AwWohl_01120 [Gammaproteobacteria bacterium]|nr:hypothetical protein AwWohl_01120 [Gammaproteobacteria bacterium]